MKRFEITDEQERKIKRFHPKCKKKYMGAIGGGECYIFKPTSLGTIVKYQCNCGKILDLTDVDSW